MNRLSRIDFPRLNWLLLAALTAAAGARPAAAQTLVPLGLDCGMTYVINNTVIQSDACNNTPTVVPTTVNSTTQSFQTTNSTCADVPCNTACRFDFVMTTPPFSAVYTCNQVTQLTPSWDMNPQSGAATGFQAFNDGDNGITNVRGSAPGFSHQEIVSSTATLTVSSAVGDASSFVLPQGAICGFHRTDHGGHTCMGFDAASSCPPGWTRRSALDVNSGTQSWVWCEYQDLLSKSVGQPTIPFAGLACGISDNPGTGGVCMGYDVLTGAAPNCPGMTATASWRDDGASSGQGLGYCSILGPFITSTSVTLPPHAPPPRPPPACTGTQIDCCGDGTYCPATQATCRANFTKKCP
jgi:hypothetical protein